MKRDMDLVRKIVFALEGQECGDTVHIRAIEGYSDEMFGRHCFLMMEAGLIRGTVQDDMHTLHPTAIPYDLAWTGHEFADAARNEVLWNQANSTIKAKVGSVSVAVFTQFLQTLAKSAIGIG